MEFLDRLFVVPLDVLPFVLIVLLISFSVHEFAHAYAAWKFGDPTAKMLGRVTLNPAKHFDFLGALLFILVGFGWAKPVPVNRDNFKKPRLMGIIVSAVGPLSNLLLALIGSFIFYIGLKFGWYSIQPADKMELAMVLFLTNFIKFNTLLFLFNLIPLPPLDGYRIIEDLAPKPLRIRMQQIEQWSIFIFMLIVFIPQLRAITIGPLFSLIDPIVGSFMQFARFVVGT
ncbi:site-2 protease family protein [Paenibacillus sp. 481]|uniref:site-2 protease family protein n=1 Tax=Paenibacillus sp. 481 TaxID=2835869 RepID=UPI001E3B2000|nr:site-2 protease family protein [Paenibacillus sp. 481]UHA74185.1 site-2 protease family protein [Paenibacillus sp. 481]